jgi:hypothetical protein
LGHNLHAPQFLELHGVTLSQELHRSFAKYKGKDSLMIVTTRDKKLATLPNILHWLSASGTPTRALSSLVSSGATTAPQEGDMSNNSSYKAVTDAALTLQAFWRKRREYLHSHRMALNTTLAKANMFVFEKFIRGYRQKDSRSRIRKTFVMVKMGVQFYIAIWALGEKVTSANTLWTEVAGDKSLSASDLEELVSGELVGDLRDIDNEVFGNPGGIWAKFQEQEVKKMFNDERVTWTDMKSVFGKANKKIASMEHRLKEIMARLENMRVSQ